MKKILGPLKYLPIILLSGCISIGSPHPPFPEPDPAKEATARLRTIVMPTVSADISLHKNNDRNICLIEEGALAIPVHTITLGWEGESTKKIGMPIAEAEYGEEQAFAEKYGAESYIPVNNDLTISGSFSAQTAYATLSCRTAFRFKPIADKNYQLWVSPGVRKDGKVECTFQLQEILKDSTSGKYIKKDVVTTPIVVPGSPAWTALCIPTKTDNAMH